MIKYFKISAAALILLSGVSVYAQSTRSSVNKGVDLYKQKKYVDSEVEFKKGLESSPGNFQANFNLGDAYYKQGKYDEALKAYSSALEEAHSKNFKARVYHNIGNALLQSKKIKESVGAYINSLKLNPDDQATKYNLSYALDMLKNKDQNQKNNKNDKKNQDKNKKDQNKNNQNKNNQNNQNKDQQNKQQQNKNDQNKQQQNEQKQQQQNQPQPNKISKQQADAILNALNNNEKDIQKNLRKVKGTPVKTGKDW